MTNTTTKFTNKDSYRYGVAQLLLESYIQKGDTFVLTDVNSSAREWIYKSLKSKEIIADYELLDGAVKIDGFKMPRWYKDNFYFQVKDFLIYMVKKSLNLSKEQAMFLYKSKLVDLEANVQKVYALVATSN